VTCPGEGGSRLHPQNVGWLALGAGGSAGVPRNTGLGFTRRKRPSSQPSQILPLARTNSRGAYALAIALAGVAFTPEALGWRTGAESAQLAGEDVSEGAWPRGGGRAARRLGRYVDGLTVMTRLRFRV
jgi:hypothetical protein